MDDCDRLWYDILIQS